MMGEVSRLREELAGTGRTYLAQPYPRELRWRAVTLCEELRRDGWSWTEISSEFGVAVGSIRRWCAEATREPAGFFVPVELREPVPTSGGVLVLPCGVRVEGLRVEELGLVLRALL